MKTAITKLENLPEKSYCFCCRQMFLSCSWQAFYCLYTVKYLNRRVQNIVISVLKSAATAGNAIQNRACSYSNFAFTVFLYLFVLCVFPRIHNRQRQISVVSKITLQRFSAQVDRMYILICVCVHARVCVRACTSLTIFSSFFLRLQFQQFSRKEREKKNDNNTVALLPPSSPVRRALFPKKKKKIQDFPPDNSRRTERKIEEE